MGTSFLNIVILMFISVCAVALFKRVHLPPILAYLFAGILAGPQVLTVFANPQEMHLLAEVGIVFLLFSRINSIRVDNEKAGKIAYAIRQGAMTFLNEEYKIIAVVVAIVATMLGFFMSPLAGGVFVVGALMSLTTGFLGMRAATSANVRTTIAAKDSGEHEAFMIAFFGGGVMGFAVASIGLLGLGTIFYLFLETPS